MIITRSSSTARSPSLLLGNAGDVESYEGASWRFFATADHQFYRISVDNASRLQVCGGTRHFSSADHPIAEQAASARATGHRERGDDQVAGRSRRSEHVYASSRTAASPVRSANGSLTINTARRSRRRAWRRRWGGDAERQGSRREARRRAPRGRPASRVGAAGEGAAAATAPRRIRSGRRGTAAPVVQPAVPRPARRAQSATWRVASLGRSQYQPLIRGADWASNYVIARHRAIVDPPAGSLRNLDGPTSDLEVWPATRCLNRRRPARNIVSSTSRLIEGLFTPDRRRVFPIREDGGRNWRRPEDFPGAPVT